MHKRINYHAKTQVAKLFNNSGINCIGQSKHQAKHEQLALGCKTSEEIHENMGIYGINTGIKYQKVWTQVFVHAMEKYNITHIEQINSKHINSFLTSHADDAKKTMKSYLSAIKKFETALTWQSIKDNTHRNYDFKSVVKKHREVARAKAFDYKDRTYSNVQALVDNVHRPEHKLLAQIMQVTGCRISEAAHITAGQIDGNKFYFNGKGGKAQEKTLPTYIVNQLQDHFAKNNGLFKVNQNMYRESLKKSAEATGQNYTGSHGIRWTFAKMVYQTKLNKLFEFKYIQRMLKAINMTAQKVKEKIYSLKHREIVVIRNNQLEKIEREVSIELGHNRPSITRHYLGFGAAA